MESFIPDPLVNLITLSKLDGRQIGDFKPELYDKVTLLVNDISSFWFFSCAALFFMFFQTPKNISLIKGNQGHIQDF